MKKKYPHTKRVRTIWEKSKYIFIAISFCAIAFTPLIHTFLSGHVDREYSIKDTTLHEGLNILDDTYEIEITDGKVTCFREYDATVINLVFGWKNWRQFLLGGSPYFCLFFLTLFCVWIFTYKDRADILFQKTVITVLSFFGLVAVWFTIYALYPKPDIPYNSYYFLLFLGSLLINTSIIFFIKWAINKQISNSEMKFKIRSLMKYISIDILSKYIRKSDEKKYFTDTLKQVEELNQNSKMG